MGKLRTEHVRGARPHSRERTRNCRHHAFAQLEVPRPPVCGRARVTYDDATVGQARAELVKDPLRVQGISVLHPLVLEDLPPTRDIFLDLLPPRAVLLTPQVRDERPQGLLAVADYVDLHGIADAQHLAVYVDLYSAPGPAPVATPSRGT